MLDLISQISVAIIFAATSRVSLAHCDSLSVAPQGLLIPTALLLQEDSSNVMQMFGFLNWASLSVVECIQVLSSHPVHAICVVSFSRNTDDRHFFLPWLLGWSLSHTSRHSRARAFPPGRKKKVPLHG